MSSAEGNNGTETRFVYDGGRVIEERRGTDDSVLASYVHGAYIDDVVTMRRAVPQGGIPADGFFHKELRRSFRFMKEKMEKSGILMRKDPIGREEAIVSYPCERNNPNRK